MITFARGLVIREGERSMEFERQLEFGKCQFKYLDNYEIRTFSMGKLYCLILAKTIQVVHQNGRPVDLPQQITVEGQEQPFKLNVTKRQEDLIDYRIKYVKAAVASRATPGSRRKCIEVIERIAEQTQDEHPPSADTLRNWLKSYIASGANAYALCDRRPLARRPKRMSQVSEMMMEAAIAKHYMQLMGLSGKDTHAKYVQDVEAKNRMEGSSIEAASERTCLRRIKDIDPYLRDFARLGPRCARNKWRYSLKGDQSTRILERVEIDHTWLDIWVLDPRSGVPIGRPWITVVLDRFSGYPLGIYISFYGPSVGSVAHAIKNSIFPKDELMLDLPGIQVPWTAMGVAELYVVDNGLEFHSRAFKRLAWDLRADLLYNPVYQPWLKASIERTMMEVGRVLPRAGKVYAPRKNMVPENPKDSAAILFDDLCLCLLRWAAEVFPQHIHPKNLVRPIDLWEEGRQSCPLPMFPLSFESFDITAGVSTHRRVDGDGVFFKYMRYNSPELQDRLRAHKQTFRAEIRFNPDCLEQIYVELPKAEGWLAVELQRPSMEYGRGLSLIQHEIIRAEAGKKLTRKNAEEELANAKARLNDQWGEAIQRGVKVRKHGSLIRLQGYTSAKVFGEKGASQAPAELQLPVVSPTIEKTLENVMPFKSFSMDEEYA